MVLFISFGSLMAQSGNDVILKTNGDEMAGKVTEINDDHVKFVYKGETIVYTVKKSEILKITFASGRVEKYNTGGQTPEKEAAPEKPGYSASTESHANKMAVLPFRFIADKQSADEEMGYLVQEEAFSYIMKHSAGYQIQDPATTNALLLKAGVNQSTARAFTPVDLCNILGVEMVVVGTINQDRGPATTYSSGSASRKTDYNTGKNNNTTKSSGYASSSSSTVQNFKTSVTLSVFSDKGTSLFSQEHTAFWNTSDAYKNAIQYLVKRTPFYKK